MPALFSKNKSAKSRSNAVTYALFRSASGVEVEAIGQKLALQRAAICRKRSTQTGRYRRFPDL
jgi:hypothetical protein